MAYKYLIKDKATGKKRLVEASSPANAIAHVAKDGFTSERVSDDVAEMLGLPVEKVTADKPAETPATGGEESKEVDPPVEPVKSEAPTKGKGSGGDGDKA